jgi:tetratricopeptide (TPR) repeat protein
MRGVIVLLCLGWTTLLSAQQSTNTSVADAHFAAGRWAEAAAAYEKVLQATADNGTAWFRLGLAQINLEKWALAKTALARAVALNALPARSHYNLALVHAHDNVADSVYAHLNEAVKAGMIYGKFIRNAPQFAPLLKDKRMIDLLEQMDRLEFPCKTNPESRKLDFWAGSWDVYVSGVLAGTNDVQPMLGQCALLENWVGAQAGAGKSLNFFDPQMRMWRQVWIADNGSVHEYKGEYRDGAMRFIGEIRGANGTVTMQRLTLTPLAPDSVRQLFEGSTDGKTWTPGFDGLYVRRKK